MQKIWVAIAAATGAAMLAASPTSAATVLEVNPKSGCGVSNCFNSKGVFTQTWSAAGAKGPMTIGQFLMSRGVLGDLDSKTFRITFSVGGKELGTWGSYNMGAIGGQELKFDGLDFLWNPEDGDLVLTLALAPARKGGFGGGGGGGGFASAPSEGGSAAPPGESAPSYFAVGEPPVPPPAETSQVQLLALSVPEPTAWALMIMGFGLAGATLRRRRPVLARATSKRLT